MILGRIALFILYFLTIPLPWATAIADPSKPLSRIPGDPMIPLMFVARRHGDFDLVGTVTILQQFFARLRPARHEMSLSGDA
jgi:hypothetical protein